MEITPELKITWKEEKAILHDEIKALENIMSEFKTIRKADWKAFKRQYHDDLGKIQKTLQKLTDHHKK